MRTEIFISLVDITCIFMLLSARVLNIVLATPGLVIMPLPTTETLETLLSSAILLNSIDVLSFSIISYADDKSDFNTVASPSFVEV